MFKLKISAVSDVGRFRDNNEDNLYLDCGVFNESSADKLEYSYETDTGTERVFAVCDGMGGGAMGEEMSLIAVRRLHELHPDLLEQDTEAVLNRHANEANRMVCERLNAAGAEMGGTTSVVVTMKDDSINVFHLGDSRAYLMRGDSISLITEDHTLAQRKIKMGIYKEDDPWAQREKHMLTKFIGADKTYLGLTYQHDQWFRLRTGDIILLCSDGVNDGCGIDAIGGVLAEHRGDAAKAVVECALDAGSRDNTTAVVIEVMEAAEQPAAKKQSAPAGQSVGQSVPQTTAAKKPIISSGSAKKQAKHGEEHLQSVQTAKLPLQADAAAAPQAQQRPAGSRHRAAEQTDRQTAPQIEAYRRAAKAGDPAAMVKFGYECIRMEAWEQAVYWFDRALGAGNPEAAYYLGWCYKHGRGVRRSTSQAVKYFKIGAKAGDPRAIREYAACYERGEGVVWRDQKKAIYLYRRAAEAGDAEARKMLERLLRLMNGD
ncbi:MAG: protein phosphatase 2C domain-containing protein [Butyricicoccaceae bacterium]